MYIVIVSGTSNIPQMDIAIIIAPSAPRIVRPCQGWTSGSFFVIIAWSYEIPSIGWMPVQFSTKGQWLASGFLTVATALRFAELPLL